MAARITKEHAARWQVIVPWTKGDELSEVVAVEIVTTEGSVGVKMIGGRQITFPIERAKLFRDALNEAVSSLEGPS